MEKCFCLNLVCFFSLSISWKMFTHPKMNKNNSLNRNIHDFVIRNDSRKNHSELILLQRCFPHFDEIAFFTLDLILWSPLDKENIFQKAVEYVLFQVYEQAYPSTHIFRNISMKKLNSYDNCAARRSKAPVWEVKFFLFFQEIKIFSFIAKKKWFLGFERIFSYPEGSFTLLQIVSS